MCILSTALHCFDLIMPSVTRYVTATDRVGDGGIQLAANGRGRFLQGFQVFFLVQVCAGGGVIKGAGHAAPPLAPLPDGPDWGQSLPRGDVPCG